MRIYNNNELEGEFGVPGNWANFVKIELPYKMRIAWDLTKSVDNLWCHKKIADPLKAVFEDLLKTLGYDRIVELGIDLYGGCYNYRMMRGSTKTWSRHSWAIAIDLDPARNRLRTRAPFAQFSKPEYQTLHAIFQKHGFLNYGKTKGFDWMHFEYAKK